MEDPPAAARAFWDFVAAWEDARPEGESEERAAAAALSRLRPLLPPGARAADYGCGLGRVAARVAPFCSELRLVDISPEMLRRAVLRSGGASVVSVDLTDGRGLRDVASESLDLVYSLLVFPHVPRDAAAECLRTFAAALRPGGYLVVEFLDREAASGTRGESVRVGGPGPLVEYDRAELARMIAAVGMVVERMEAEPPYVVVTASKPAPRPA